MSSEPLQEAYRLIREGSPQEAIRILVPLVRADPLNADAWWLLANSVENRDQKRQALERVLKLRPGDAAAQKMLDQLGGALPAKTPRPQTQAPKAKRKRRDPSLAPDPDSADDEFDLFDVPSGNVRLRRSGSSPVTFILALIGLLTVVSCGICVVVFAFSAPQITTFVQQIALTITVQPGIPSLPNLPGLPNVATAVPQSPLAAPTADPSKLPGDLQMQGSVTSGQAAQHNVVPFRDDGWTYAGTANEHVVIEVDAVDAKLDPHLYLYDPNGTLIAENDDIDSANNRNSRIDVTLATSGTYTIRVSAFADGGDYQLTVDQPN